MKAGQYLTFRLMENSYAIGIEKVREINRLKEIAKVPESPDYISGVINLRGKIIPVMDLRKRLQLGAMAATKQSCIIVIESHQRQMGIIVDSVTAVIDLNSDQIDASPLCANQGSFMQSIGKLDDHLILLLDIDQFLAPDDNLSKSA